MFVCGTKAELMKKHEKRKAELLAVAYPERKRLDRLGGWACEMLVNGLVILMAALPYLILLGIGLFTLAMMWGAVEVLGRWVVAVWRGLI